MEDGKGLSFTSFVLWTILTWISCITTKRQGGATPAVPRTYAIGATVMTIVLACKHRYSTLTTLDGTTAALVVLCLILWVIKGDKWALIISVIASSIAGIPYIVMTYTAPLDSPFLVNTGFLIANSIAFISAGELSIRKWTVEDRLFTGVSILTGVVMIFPWVWCVYFN
jgi:hypothetical protein